VGVATAASGLGSLKSSANSLIGGVTGAPTGEWCSELLELLELLEVLLLLGSTETSQAIPWPASHRDKQKVRIIIINK